MIAIRDISPSGRILRFIDDELVPLSSGQISFIRLAAQLSLFIENGSLVLLDEPETHLHPDLLTDTVAVLDKVLELSGSIAIAATHSAYLVREVPSSQVHIIKTTKTNRVEVVQPRLKTFGADVGTISQFVFGDAIVNRLVDSLENALDAEDPASTREWLESIKAELSTEAMMHLIRELDLRQRG